jgi:hypothetical protein
MPNQQNDNRDQNLNPNNSDNLRDLRNTDMNQPASDKGQHHGSSSTLDSLLSPSTLGMGTDGTGQNYSGGTGSQATDQNRSGSMSGQTGSEDAAGRMTGREVPGDSARKTGDTTSGKSGYIIQQNLRDLGEDNGFEQKGNR